MGKTNEMCSFAKDEYGLQTGTVKISELHEFKGHPFKVENDIQLFELMRSIEDKGVLVPLIVRSNPYGEGYEIIAGHRRKAVCAWAGIEEVPVIIRELDDADAVIAMIDSNLQREHIKPSEKAYAYKMKLDAMKSQGKRNDLFVSQVGTKLEKEQTKEGKTILRADERLAKEVGESRNQIARYIRLMNLVPKILDMVDEGKIAFTIGVELSYLTEEEQYELHAMMDLEQCTPSLSQANKMKRMSQAGTLDMEEMYPMRYLELCVEGELRTKAAEVNEEAMEVLATMVQVYVKKHKPKNPDFTMEMWRLREQARAIAEEFILEDIVCRFH